MYLLSLYLVIGESINITPVFAMIGVAFLLVVLFGAMSPDRTFAQGLKADVGDEISLVSSKSGFALNSAANLIYAGASLNELKTDLDLRTVESVLRVRESEIKASQYDLFLKTDDLLIAQIKAEDPIEPRESVNQESIALMESSASVYATMFAADDLIVDTAIKVKQRKA